MNTIDYSSIIELLAQYDYALAKTTAGHYHIYAVHGDFHASSDNQDYVLYKAVLDFLNYALGHRHGQVWEALKRSNKHKALFENWQDIDAMIDYSLALHEAFLEAQAIEDIDVSHIHATNDNLPF